MSLHVRLALVIAGLLFAAGSAVSSAADDLATDIKVSEVHLRRFLEAADLARDAAIKNRVGVETAKFGQSTAAGLKGLEPVAFPGTTRPC